MKKTVVVLGASGFLGESLCELLSKHKIHLLLASKHGGKFCNVPIQKLDLCIKGSLFHWLGSRHIDAMFYLSSQMPYQFMRNEQSSFNQNVLMHQNIHQYWLAHKFHLIYASSASVYGKSSSPCREEGPVCPESFYAISKLVGEEIFSLPSGLQNPPLTILRIKAPYGVKSRGKTVMNIFLENALLSADLQLWGSGQRRQDFIYSKDVARAFWLAFLKKKYGVYNIASGKEVSMKQLARVIIRVTQSQSRIIFNGQGDPQENIKASISTSKACKELGFTPQYTLESGLKEMVNIYKRGRLSN